MTEKPGRHGSSSSPQRHEPERPADIPLSLLLAALAGTVDAIGFLHWRGLFLSFMSGNSTILGIAAAQADGMAAAVSVAVLAGLVGGVVLGELLDALGRHARAAVLALEAVLLAGCAAASVLVQAELIVAPLLSLAMGVQNAAVRRADGVGLSLTYVTGTLVQVGRGIAAALRGLGGWSATLPHLALWTSLIAGSAMGTLLAERSEPLALALAAGTALLLAGIAMAARLAR